MKFTNVLLLLAVMVSSVAFAQGGDANEARQRTRLLVKKSKPASVSIYTNWKRTRSPTPPPKVDDGGGYTNWKPTGIATNFEAFAAQNNIQLTEASPIAKQDRLFPFDNTGAVYSGGQAVSGGETNGVIILAPPGASVGFSAGAQ